jgi:predicted flap endonuclease-1-like 5' DNA nuclease
LHPFTFQNYYQFYKTKPQPSAMTLKEKVEHMDSLVLTGKFVEAVEQYFHPEAIAHSAPTDRNSGKATKIESLKAFFNGIRQINHIKLHHCAIGEEVTMSEFTFNFTSIYGSPVSWHEVIRRRWKDGLVYDEQYFMAEQTAIHAPVAQPAITEDSAGMTRISAKYVSPVPPPPLYLLKPEEIVYTRPKKVTVMPDFAPQVAASSIAAMEMANIGGEIPAPIAIDKDTAVILRHEEPIHTVLKEHEDIHLIEQAIDNEHDTHTAIQENTEIQATTMMESSITPIEAIVDEPNIVIATMPDDLKKIEGIGPKIEQILNDGGIHTFKQLAKANADHLKELLLNAGPRFRMHDPATWMQQADLAAKGDWTTLDALQKALKGGRAVK